MAYVAGNFDSMHLYLQWAGNLPGGEHFSCGLRMRNKGTGTAADAAAMLAPAAVATSAYHAGPDTYISPNALLTSVKLNAIGVDGHYALTSATNEQPMANVPGAGSATPPNQICQVVTLTTGFSRGPAHKGRFYLPLPGNSLVPTDGRISASSTAQISTATDTFVAALNAINAQWEVAVFSRKAGAAGNRRVTGNLVGRVLDTQRRRRRSMAEDYQ